MHRELLPTAIYGNGQSEIELYFSFLFPFSLRSSFPFHFHFHFHLYFHPPVFHLFSLSLPQPQSSPKASGACCKLPKLGLGSSFSRNQICSILALKSDIRWHQFYEISRELLTAMYAFCN